MEEKMAKISCSKGHFYDSEKHSACPFCGVNIEDFDIHIHSNNSAQKQTSDPYCKTLPIEPLQNSLGKTMPLGSVITPVADIPIEPVTGWVVCMNGKGKGKDFKIHKGFNKIGRSDVNDICLSFDDTVVMKSHANLIHDSKTNYFYITVGPEKSSVYLNDQLVQTEAILKPYDQIKLGQTELRFIPFCIEQFKW